MPQYAVFSRLTGQSQNQKKIIKHLNVEQDMFQRVIDVFQVKRVEKAIARKLTQEELLIIYEGIDPLWVTLPNGKLLEVKIHTYGIKDLMPDHEANAHDDAVARDEIYARAKYEEGTRNMRKNFSKEKSVATLKREKDLYEQANKDLEASGTYNLSPNSEHDLRPQRIGLHEGAGHLDLVRLALLDLESREQVDPLDSHIIVQYSSFGKSDIQISKDLKHGEFKHLNKPISHQAVRKRRVKTLSRMGMKPFTFR